MSKKLFLMLLLLVVAIVLTVPHFFIHNNDNHTQHAMHTVNPIKKMVYNSQNLYIRTMMPIGKLEPNDHGTYEITFQTDTKDYNFTKVIISLKSEQDNSFDKPIIEGSIN